MCIFPKIPGPEPIQSPATVADANVQQARSDTQKRARQASGANSTRVASSTPTMTTGKTLLGQ